MKKEIPFGIAIIPIIITVAVMMVTIVVLKQSPSRSTYYRYNRCFYCRLALRLQME